MKKQIIFHLITSFLYSIVTIFFVLLFIISFRHRSNEALIIAGAFSVMFGVFAIYEIRKTNKLLDERYEDEIYRKH